MKANSVLKLLNVTRQTLYNYTRLNKIKSTKLPNGRYEYDKDSVYKMKNMNKERTNIIYCRVSSSSQKKDLERQKETLKIFCNKNGIIISEIYSDISSGLNFDRKDFQKMLMRIVNHEIDRIYITYKDRLSRISFNMFKELFEHFNCEIIVINEIDDEKTIEKEIFNEIVSLIHCFSMKLYNKRKRERLQLMEKQLKLEGNDDNN